MIAGQTIYPGFCICLCHTRGTVWLLLGGDLQIRFFCLPMALCAAWSISHRSIEMVSQLLPGLGRRSGHDITPRWPPFFMTLALSHERNLPKKVSQRVNRGRPSLGLAGDQVRVDLVAAQPQPAQIPKLIRARLASTFNLEPCRRWYSEIFQHDSYPVCSCFRRQFVEWDTRKGPVYNRDPLLGTPLFSDLSTDERRLPRIDMLRKGPGPPAYKTQSSRCSRRPNLPSKGTASWQACLDNPALIPHRSSSCSNFSTTLVPEISRPRFLSYQTTSFTSCGQHLWPTHHVRNPNTRCS
jgi:hypothetical protein